jgi:hypothetical protein
MSSQDGSSSRTERISRLALWVFGGVALFYLLAEHRAHALGWLPYLIFLACPLMHLFMHHGHDAHGEPNQAKDTRGDEHDHAGHRPS